MDHRTSREWSRFLIPQLGLPFLSLVWSPQGASGCLFDVDGSRSDEVELEAIGKGHIVPLSRIENRRDEVELDDRQRRALSGLGNARLRGLRLGVVGAGGTGSIVIDQLARMGVSEIVIVDPDAIDTESNLRRVVGAVREDFRRKHGKADVASRHVAALALGSRAFALQQDVRTIEAATALVDCDAVVVTTDTHASRAFVNQQAYQHWLPIIDVGLRVGTSLSGEISGMPVEIRTLLPDNGCLWCRNILDAYRIRAESLPEDERERLTAEGYVQGIDAPVGAVGPLNALAGQYAVLRLIRTAIGGEDSHAQVIFDPWETYLVSTDAPVNSDCVCHQWRGAGEDFPLPYLPAHSGSP